MSHIEELDELLQPYGFDLWEDAADGTATWQHTHYDGSPFPLTTRVCIRRANDDDGLVLNVEHEDFRGPFYTKPLRHLDVQELVGLLNGVMPDEEDDD